MEKSNSVLVITSIKLRSPFFYFALSLWGLKIVRQIKSLPCLGWKASGFWTDHYTMTLWESQPAINSFVRAGAHKLAMTQGPKIASEVRTLTLNSPTMLPWKVAIERLKKEGRIISF